MVDGQPGSGVRACLPVSVCVCGGWVWWVGLGTLGVTLTLTANKERFKVAGTCGLARLTFG